MKKGIVAMIMCGILGMSAPVMADFDYSQLDSMTLEELETLDRRVEKKIVDVKFSTGVYPWKSYKTYEDENIYGIGDTWEVQPLWKVSVDNAVRTDIRDEHEDESPTEVYVITYTYENIGYTWGVNGLQFSLLTDATFIDNDGEIGYTYGHQSTYPEMSTTAKYIPVGARVTVTDVIGVNHPGAFKIIFDHSGNEDDKHTGTFLIDIP